MFLVKGALKICNKFTGEHPCRLYWHQLYWNHTSTWMFSCKFAAYFQNTFYYKHLWMASSEVSIIDPWQSPIWCLIPVGIYMFKVNKRNTRTECQIYSKLTIKTPGRRQWCRSGVFIVNFEYIPHLVLVFLLFTLSR